MPRRAAALGFLIAILAAPGLAATLQGNGVTLEVSEEAPTGIVAVRHGPDAPGLFADGEEVQCTWELVMVAPAGNEVKVDPVSAKLGGRVELAQGAEARLTITWDAVEVPTGTVKVSCTFEPDPQQPLIYGNITVDNNSDCQLREVQFPRMTLVPNPEPAESITLVFPRAYGRSWRNPFDAPRGYLVGTMEPAGFRGSAEMQFGTIYDDAGNGLYWAAYDGEGYHKRFVYDNKEVRGQIQLKLAYIPENCLTPGVDFDSPYPIVLGAYQGDWWDAAQMYREWALQQKWCARGPLVTRADIPRWVKETDVWIRGQGRYGLEVHRKFNAHIQELFDGDIGVQWYHWCKPRNFANVLRWPMWEGFPELCRESGERGIHWEPYVNSYQWNSLSPNFPKGGEKWALHDEEGNPQATGYAEEGSKPLAICASAQVWRRALVEACVRLVREGHQQGIYLDQLGGQCGRPCYSAEHGHPVGGGHYASDGLREICAAVRTAIREVDPEAAVSGEVQHETLLDVTDHRLTHYNVWPQWVNLWAAVYGDMSATYGRTVSWRGDTGAGDSFYGACGNTFVSGIQFARIWPSGNEEHWLGSPTYAEQADYFKTVVDLRRAARGFLEYGWLQRPVKITTEVPQITINAHMGSKVREFEIPALLASAWASHDGDLAFIFTNVSTQPLAVTWQADLSRYEIADAEVYDLRQIMPDGGKKAVGQLETRLLKRTETMEPHSAVVYEVTVGTY